MGVRINISLGASAGLEAAEWCPEDGMIHVCCPICSVLLRLDYRHVIACDGAVTPALSCYSCPFLDWIHLDAWQP